MKALKALSFCLIAILGLTSVVTGSSSSEIQSTILYVKPGGTGDCLEWSTACELQTAFSLAELGDQIRVAAGIYMPTTDSDREASFSLESGVAIYGGFPTDGGTWEERDWETNPTTLSGDLGIGGDIADNSYHVVTGSGVDETAILDGFTISDGYADTGGYPQNAGSGMFNNTGSPTLTNINFSGNTAMNGAGMYNAFSSPILTDVIFSGNYAQGDGGGMLNDSSSPTLTNVTFSGNSATSGGGMYNYINSSPILTNVAFSGNYTSGVFYGYGGGMYNVQSSPILTDVTFVANISQYSGGGMYNNVSSPTLTDVIFSENSAPYGGGMYNGSSSPILTNITFSDNEANVGGGIFNYENSNPSLTKVTFSGNTANYGGGMFNGDSNPTLTNVTFSGNSAIEAGGGMDNQYSSPILTNVTFSENSANLGGGIYNYECSHTLINSIMWGNTPDQIYNTENSSTTITYSDIQGEDVWEGTGNINDNPLLDPLANNGGFTQTHALGDESPAIDAGDPNLCPPTDQRSIPRPIDGDWDGVAICDMGAYEYGSPLSYFYLPLIVK